MQLQTIQTCSPPVTFRAIARRSASSTQKVVANHKNGTSEPRVLQKLYIPQNKNHEEGGPIKSRFVVRRPTLWCVLRTLTWKCAPRHNGVHFFNIISTSKSGPRPSVFNAFDFEMCFAPQWRALFRHLSFQKCSDVGVFCTFWLRNVLRATTACTFSSLIWPDGSSPAALASLLFDPPEPQIIGKTQWVATFLPFRAPASSSFFWLFLFSDLLSSSLLFSDSSHLCFSICPYCRKFDF